jgi:hypothetical protein
MSVEIVIDLAALPRSCERGAAGDQLRVGLHQVFDDLEARSRRSVLPVSVTLDDRVAQARGDLRFGAPHENSPLTSTLRSRSSAS